MSLPIIAIIGRPNTGKSTLFNALSGWRKSIVSNIAGTTRDSVVEKITTPEGSYLLVDTAGLTNAEGDNLDEMVQRQATTAIENADALIFVVDGKVQPTQDDYAVADVIRRSGKACLFVANKIDDGQEDKAMDWVELGYGMPRVISAKNGYALDEIQDDIADLITEAGMAMEIESEREDGQPLRLCFIGRPNVGKSSLTNHLMGKDISIVSDISGTTRDTVDSEYTSDNGDNFVLIDTAGLRKKGKIGRSLEYWSAVRTRVAIERSDVCCLLIDALDGVTHQDMTIMGEVIDAGKGLMIGVNKFDLVYAQSRMEEDADERDLSEVHMWGDELHDIQKRYLRYMAAKVSFAPWAPVSFFSAKTGKGTQKLLENAVHVQKERERRISTADLNRFLPEVYYGSVPPSVGTKQGKLKFMSQVGTCPPQFILHVNNEKAIHYTYRRYVLNKIREKYGFHGTPIKLTVRDAMDKAPQNKK